MQEVAVVQGLQTQVVELLIALGLQGLGQTGQVVVQQLGVEQLVVHALLDEAWEVVGIGGLHFGRCHIAAHDFAHDGVQQQTGRDIGVVGIFFDQRAGRQDGCLEHFFDRHAVIQIAQRLGHDGRGLDVGIQIAAGRCYQRLQAFLIQGHALAVIGHLQGGLGSGCCGSGHGCLFLLGTLLVAGLAVQHIGTGHVLVAAAHQAQLDLVLDVFDVEGTAVGARALQSANHAFGQFVDGIAHAGGGCTLCAAHSQKCLGQGHGDFLGGEGNHVTAAADDLVAVGLGGRIGCAVGRGRRQWVQRFLHKFPLVQMVDRQTKACTLSRPANKRFGAGFAHSLHRVCTTCKHYMWGLGRSKTLPVVYRSSIWPT